MKMPVPTSTTFQTPGAGSHTMVANFKPAMAQVLANQRTAMDRCRDSWNKGLAGASTEVPGTYPSKQVSTDVVGHRLPPTDPLSKPGSCGGSCGCGGTCGKKEPSCDYQHEVDYRIPGMSCGCANTGQHNTRTAHQNLVRGLESTPTLPQVAHYFGPRGGLVRPSVFLTQFAGSLRQYGLLGAHAFQGSGGLTIRNPNWGHYVDSGHKKSCCCVVMLRVYDIYVDLFYGINRAGHMDKNAQIFLPDAMGIYYDLVYTMDETRKTLTRQGCDLEWWEWDSLGLGKRPKEDWYDARKRIPDPNAERRWNERPQSDGTHQLPGMDAPGYNKEAADATGHPKKTLIIVACGVSGDCDPTCERSEDCFTVILQWDHSNPRNALTYTLSTGTDLLDDKRKKELEAKRGRPFSE